MTQGGPWFETIDGSQYIVGVHSRPDRYPDPDWYDRNILGITQPDIDNAQNYTFGEVTIATRVGMNYERFIEPNTTPGNTDLVLDMNYQVFGVTNGAGGADNLTITVQNVDGNLQLSVVNPAEPNNLYNGLYYSVPVATINSLTIRGSADNETFRIVGDLGISGNVYIDGGGGTNQVYYDDGGAAAVPHGYTFANQAEPGYTLRLNRSVNGQNIPGVDSVNVTKYTLLGSPGNDTIAVDYLPAGLTDGASLHGHTGNDWIVLGSAPAGMANVQRPVYADGGTGQDELWFRDAANTAANMHYTLDKSAVAGWGYTLHRTANGAFVPNVEFSAAEKISLDTGSQADVVRLYALPDITLGTHVNSNGGTDTIVVGNHLTRGLADILGQVFVQAGGQAGDTVTFDDAHSPTGVQAPNQYTLESSPHAGYEYRLSRNAGLVNFPAIDARGAGKYVLEAGPFGDIINVNTAPGAASAGVFINGREGNDTIKVGLPAGPGLNAILAAVTVDGQAGNNALLVDNRGAAVRNLTVTKTVVTRSDGKTVNFSNVKSIEVKTDGGQGNVNVQEKAAGVDVKVSMANSGNTAAFGNGVFGFQLGGDPNWITVGGYGNQVTLGGSLSLSVLPAFAMPVGWVITLVDNQTDQPITGIFDNLPEGSVITVGQWQFRLSYVGQALGSSFANDVTLTILAIPGGGGPGSE